ncbi:MAG: cell envelope integrity protein TolA [Pseudomonadota bacterium]
MVQSRSLSFSIVLHTVAVLFAAFGLPVLMPSPTEPIPLVMTVELLPVGDVTNVKPSEKPIQQEQKAQAAKNSKPITPTAQEKPKAPTPPAPPEKKPFDPTEDAVPAPDAKEKPVEKPKDEAKSKPDDFAKLLNQLQEEAKAEKSKDAKDKTTGAENKTKSDAPYDDSAPLSISEKDTIRSQFLVCWTMPAGAKDAQSLAARIKVEFQADGTVLSATLAADQQGRYGSDPFFRAAADSAIRAVHKCSPLKNLPPEKYNSWRSMEMNFDPKDM